MALDDWKTMGSKVINHVKKYGPGLLKSLVDNLVPQEIKDYVTELVTPM